MQHRDDGAVGLGDSDMTLRAWHEDSNGKRKARACLLWGFISGFQRHALHVDVYEIQGEEDDDSITTQKRIK